MKKFTTLVLMLLISCCFMLAGCGGTPLAMPSEYANAVSNGGFVVGAGNFMYFANAYKDNSSLTSASENNGGGVKQHSLKRAEIGTSHSWFDIKKDEDKNIVFENVANKIAGYQVSNMYAVGNYLYFTSPNTHKNKENAYEFTLHSLFRIKLDGTGLTEILTTKSAEAKFYLTGGEKSKLLIFDDEKIKTIDVNNGSASVSTLVEDVESVVFPSVEEQEIAWLYYTSEREEEDLFTGNILNKVSLETGEKVEGVSKVAGQTITLIAQENGRLFYTKSGGAKEGLFSNDFSNTSSEVCHRTVVDGIAEGTLMYLVCENSDYNAFVFMYNNNLYMQLITATNDSQATKISTETTTLQFINGSYVYYSTETGIYRYSVMDKVQKQISDITAFNSKTMDFDGRYVYFFASSEDHTSGTEYLYRADAYADGNLKTECIAELLEEDIKEEEEN